MTPDEFIEQATAAIEDTYDIPFRGQGFARSVRRKLENMVETIEDWEGDEVTEGQETALRNMVDGISKWLR